MVQNKAKKRKVVKDADANAATPTKIVKKQKRKKPLQKTPKKEPVNTNPGDSDSETESEKLQNLLEPYPKDQLIEFVIDAALNDPSLLARIHDVADKDVSHRKIFVYGLGWDTTKETLASAFQQYGEIEDCNVIADHHTGKSKGYGFVFFKDRSGASKALKEPRKKINDRFISCQLASIGSVKQTNNQDTTGRKIYVGGVHPDIDPDKLRTFFSKFGEIETGPIGFDMHTGKSRGFALFVYKTFDGAKKALEEPHKILDGHQLNCSRATSGTGKGKVGGEAASITTAVQPMQAQMLGAFPGAHNMALFGQNPSMNPFYGGLIGNPNAGLLMNAFAAGGLGQVGQMGGAGMGLVGYGGMGSLGMGSLAGNSSMFGAYNGSSSAASPALQGLQHTYPNSHLGQTSSAKFQGSSGSFNDYSR